LTITTYQSHHKSNKKAKTKTKMRNTFPHNKNTMDLTTEVLNLKASPNPYMTIFRHYDLKPARSGYGLGSKGHL